MGTYVLVVGGGSLIAPANTDRGSDRAGDDACHDAPAAVVAVDSGLDVAREAGLTPTLIVGDLDSISADGLVWARRQGIPVEKHPADKDATDTALAIRAAAALAAGDPDAVLHLRCGPSAERLDHLLGLLAALGAASVAAFARVCADIGVTRAYVLHPGREVRLSLPARRVFSLLSMHGTCTGVDVERARWPLSGATLGADATVGISNESCGEPVTVRCGGGVLTVVVPAVSQPIPQETSPEVLR